MHHVPKYDILFTGYSGRLPVVQCMEPRAPLACLSIDRGQPTGLESIGFNDSKSVSQHSTPDLISNVICVWLLGIILSVPMRTESFKMFNYLKILSVFDVYIFRLSMFAFKYENDLLAECFTGFFIKKTVKFIAMQRDKLKKCMCQNIIRLQLRKLCVIDVSKFGIMSAQ